MANKAPLRKRKVSLEAHLTTLGIDATFEPVTKAGFDYRQANVYPYLKAKGFALQLLTGSLARRVYVAPAARQSAVVFITGLGHGSYDRFTGDYFDVIFKMGDYSQEEVQGKVVHLISCETARNLGTDVVSHGCKAFFGYDEDFSFQMDDANIFFECDGEIDKALADGLTASEAYTRVVKLFDKKIADFRAQGKDYKAATLEFDRDHLRAPSSGNQWGDPKTRLS